MSTALQRALNGAPVNRATATLALKDAVPLINRMKTTAGNMREASRELTRMATHEAESTGALVLSAGAEGYFGADKLKIGKVDMRAPTGLALMVLGAVRKSSRKSDGAHLYAVGQGVAHSVIASWAVRAGQKMREKSDAGGGTKDGNAATAQPSSGTITSTPGDDAAVAAFLREVKLHGDGDPALARAHRM